MTRPQPIENSVSPTNASLSAGKEYGHMAGGVARGLDHAAFERTDAHVVALADLLIDSEMRCASLLRRNNAAFVMRLERADAGRVIGVVMRDQNIREPPAGLFQRGLDRRSFRGIDRGGRAAFRVVESTPKLSLRQGNR